MNKGYTSNEDDRNLELSNVSKEYLRKIIIDYGAQVCGFANIERFEDAPSGFHPCDIYSDCKSVIAFGVSLPKGLYMSNSKSIYEHFNDDVCSKVDEIAYKIALLIERSYGGVAVPIPAVGPYEYRDKERFEGRGLLFMKHLAVHAGLGTMGKNTLFMNQSYGNRLTLGCVLTNIEVDSDSYAETLCLPNCNKCAKNCPSEVLDGSDTVDYNQCKTLCPMRFGDCVL